MTPPRGLRPFRGEPSKRFWHRVEKSDGCWLWTAGTTSDGYGSFHIGQRMLLAHRYAWELTNGPVPAGLYVCHTCDTPACVNPAHLFLGTQLDNMRDAATKGRIVNPNAAKTRCKRGHPYDAANTIQKRNGARGCRECTRARDRARRAA